MQVTSLLKILKELKKLVHPVRFELTTTGLKGRCSTIELRMRLFADLPCLHPTMGGAEKKSRGA